MMTTTAWYILPSKRGWARWINVLHLPYTLWHISYPAIGAALADELSWPLLGWTLLAFFFGMGVAAHSFDLIKGDPLRLSIPRYQLWLLASAALGAAVSIGTWQWAVGNVPDIILPLVILGAILAIGYNLEFPGFHGNWQFATWWAVFPMLVGYLAQGLQFHPVILGALLITFISAMAQRILSTRARFLRRKVEGDLSIMTSFSDCLMVDGEAVGKSWMLKPLDQTLIWLNAMIVLFALFMLLGRLLPGGGY